MEIILVLVIAGLIFLFFTNLFSQNKEIAESGGMREKYRVLLELIESTEPRMKIFEEGSNFIVIGFEALGNGLTYYRITENFGKIDVIFKTKSLFGECDFNATYDTRTDQRLIFDSLCAYVLKTQNEYILNQMNK